MWLGKLTALDMTPLIDWAVKPQRKQNSLLQFFFVRASVLSHVAFILSLFVPSQQTDVESTLNRHCFNVVCLLGSLLLSLPRESWLCFVIVAFHGTCFLTFFDKNRCFLFS